MADAVLAGQPADPLRTARDASTRRVDAAREKLAIFQAAAARIEEEERLAGLEEDLADAARNLVQAEAAAERAAGKLLDEVVGAPAVVVDLAERLVAAAKRAEAAVSAQVQAGHRMRLAAAGLGRPVEVAVPMPLIDSIIGARRCRLNVGLARRRSIRRACPSRRTGVRAWS